MGRAPGRRGQRRLTAAAAGLPPPLPLPRRKSHCGEVATGDGVDMSLRPRCWAACAAVLALLAGAAPAAARDGEDDDGRREARVAGTCAKGASSKLRLRSRDGTISVEFEVKRSRRGERWRVVLVHERRVAWRGSAAHGPLGRARFACAARCPTTTAATA